MENLLGLSIVAGFVLSMFIMMIIKNLTRMVYASAKELDDLRGTLTSITAEDAWQQALLLEDKVVTLETQVHDLITRMDDLRIKDGRPVSEAVDDLYVQLDFHCERISDDIYVEDIEVYDWIAGRDAEFANSCKVSYRYTPDGKLRDEYGR